MSVPFAPSAPSSTTSIQRKSARWTTTPAGRSARLGASCWATPSWWQGGISCTRARTARSFTASRWLLWRLQPRSSYPAILIGISSATPSSHPRCPSPQPHPRKPPLHPLHHPPAPHPAVLRRACRPCPHPWGTATCTLPATRLVLALVLQRLRWSALSILANQRGNWQLLLRLRPKHCRLTRAVSLRHSEESTVRSGGRL
mmetsp:Transcript_661/g.1426  ORF Transcript_661/g.1426 Transcript_661/m.1426 type:complete len:201 (+) Transcript_661:734-1336(+)